jgi:predicted transposase YbfD/YdcC
MSVTLKEKINQLLKIYYINHYEVNEKMYREQTHLRKEMKDKNICNAFKIK